MRSVPAEKYDQALTVHADGSPSCLLAHMLDLFDDDRIPQDPIAAKEAAVELLGISKGTADSLYMAYPLGRKTGNPSPYDAYMVLMCLALLDRGVSWTFHLAADGGEVDLPYDWEQGDPPIRELPTCASKRATGHHERMADEEVRGG